MKKTANSRVKPIIIFDSGVGGLSIYQEIKQTMPSAPVVYCSDTHGFPYGSKSEEEVIERTSLCLNALVEQFDPSLAVIACNTASTISLPRVREELDIPVVGVVPAIKTASECSEKRCIGLLATPGTIVRSYTDQLINDFAGDCRVIRVGSSELVQMVEQYLRGGTVSGMYKILAPFLEGEQVPDVVVLGCTHFSLLRTALREVSKTIHWIDSGPAIARRVASLLEPTDFEAESASNDLFIHTGQSDQVSSLVPALGRMGLFGVKYLQVKSKVMSPHSQI